MKQKHLVLFAGFAIALSAINAKAEDQEVVGLDELHHECRAILHVDKLTLTPEAAVGATVVQNIWVHNIGTCNLTGIRLTDALSPFATFVSASGTPTSVPLVGAQGGSVAWTLSLAAGASASFNVAVTNLATPNGYWKDTACARLHDDRWNFCDSLIVREVPAV